MGCVPENPIIKLLIMYKNLGCVPRLLYICTIQPIKTMKYIGIIYINMYSYFFK